MNNDAPPYEIGLALAGAVSAGAYSAGVLDFLIEALDRWDTAKNQSPDSVPSHDVQIKVLAGSSAGGMTGVAATRAFTGEHVPVTSLPEAEPPDRVVNANALYASWVEKIDSGPLLGDRDRRVQNGQVTSLLDGTILEEIADEALTLDADPVEKAYVADPVHLLLTVTNLKGVPYDIDFRGAGETAHRTARHADYKEFLLSWDAHQDGPLHLDPTQPDAPAWTRLKEYGLATGAFPGGLQPRRLTRKRADYDHREWAVPLRPGDPEETGCWTRARIEPSWTTEQRRRDSYEFLAVDGGAMNNEPFELARQRLAGDEEENPRAPTDAHRSVIMVDPLPSNPLRETQTQPDLVSVFSALFDGLMTQARFKPDELLLAQDPTVHSRYLIRPVRRNADGREVTHPIASEMLRGFGGFLSKSFRMHDFQLGRRNCQRFLQRYFVLPVSACAENPVFGQYSDAELDEYSHETDDGERVMPIIPLVDAIHPRNDAHIERPLPWTDLQMSPNDRGALRTRVRHRTSVVSTSLIEQYAPTWYVRLGAKAVSFLFRNSIVDRIMDEVTNALERYGLRGTE